MQNWNQWQMPAGTATAPMPPTPAGYTAPGADPMAIMQSYMQYYNQPAPSGYTAEQWAAAQQQNWAQWQQWQQQFQQWQAQYGEKYQETMKQLSAQGLTLPNVTQAPPLPNAQPLPPLPKEENTKPPLPPDNNNPYQYTNIPPPHQNNLPLFPAKSQSTGYTSGNAATYTQAPPLPPGRPPLIASNPQEPPSVNQLGEKRGNNQPVDFGSAKKTKIEDEELTEAEKTFDAQFKQWEEQFNKWKQQNANHPDKTQYKQYEAKWTSWREKLIERREQMRKKREQQRQTTKVESEKNKSIPGGDKILNILSSSENQGLINNLLGIGKTLGLTGKQEAERHLPSSGIASTAPLLAQQPTTSQSAVMAAPTMTNDMTQAAWAAQQWAAQYNASMGMQNYGGIQLLPGMPPPDIASQPPQIAGNNFSQPPPNLPNPGMNFSQPPPGFGVNDSRQMLGPGIKHDQRNMHDRPPTFAPDGDKRDGFGSGIDHFQSSENRSEHSSDRFVPNDRGSAANQFASSNFRFGGGTQKNEFGGGNRGGGNQFGSENERFNQSTDRFGGNRQAEHGTNEHGGPGSQFRVENDPFGPRSERLRQESDRFGNNNNTGDSGNNRFPRDNESFVPSNDRFSVNDRPGLGNNRVGHSGTNFGPGSDRFGLNNDRPGSDIDRFSLNTDHFGSSSNNDQFRSGSKDRFGPGSDRFGPGSLLGANNDRSGLGIERFDSGNSRFGSSTVNDSSNKGHGFTENFGPGKDRHNRNPDIFESKDLNYMNDNRRDSFGDNSRGAVRSVRPFEASDCIAPELKKLMEKRKAAMDVFKPRDDVFNPVKQNSIGSLSESFKKITGELPYTSRSPGDTGPKSLLGLGPRGGPDNLISRGPAEFGPRSLGPFHGNNHFNQHPPRGMEFGGFGAPGPDKFRPRGEFGSPRNEFGSSRGQGNFGPRGRGDFEPGMKDERPVVDQSGNLLLKNKDGSSSLEPLRVKDRPNFEPTEVLMESSTHGHGDKALQKGEEPQSEAALNNILPLERPPWMDAQFSEQNSNENVNDVKNSALQKSSIEIESEHPSKALINTETGKSSAPINEKSTSENNDQESQNTNENQQTNESQKPSGPSEDTNCDGKDQNSLPFMGENDPKPEDLNMEPPPELPNLGPIIETPDLSTFRSNVQDSDRPPRSITQRGPNSPYMDLPGPASVQFRPGGHNNEQFGPRGPNVNQFRPRGPNASNFGPRGPQFGPRGPNDTQFGPRGPNEGHFGPRGLGDGHFGPRGPAQFGPRDHFDNSPNMLHQRAPNDNLFGPRLNDEQFGPMGRGFPPPRGPGAGPFGQRPMNNPPFSSLRAPNEGQFRPRGANDDNYGLQAPNDSQKPAIPSLLGLQFDKQPTFDGPNAFGNILNHPKKDFLSNESSVEGSSTVDGRRPFKVNEADQKSPFPLDERNQFGSGSKFPPARLLRPDQRSPFVQGIMEQRPPFERDTPGDAGHRSPFIQGRPVSNEQRVMIGQGGPYLDSPHSQGELDQRPPFIQSGPRASEENSSVPRITSGGFDQRIDPNILEQRPSLGPGGQANSDSKMVRGREQRLKCDPKLRGNDSESKQGIKDPSTGSNISSQFNSGLYDNSQDLSNCRRTQQSSTMEEFCVGKQFNYNHGGSAIDKKISEIIPGKVIDYGHATKVIVHEYITPAQSFDYGHGNLKPIVPEHEVAPKRDFRHWEETEQSLKEYDDRLRLHLREHDWQSHKKLKDNFKFERPNSKDRDLSRSERKPFESEDRRLSDKEARARRDRDNKGERKERDRDRERGRDDREREYARDLDREDRPRRDGSDNRDRNRDRGDRNDRSDRMKMDQNKEYNRDDDRSKANVSRQEYQNKSNANTSSQESSISEAKDDSTETTSKKLELPRMPNYTMVDDILFQPGRQNRPPKIVIILRGPPGSGKSFVAKLIKDKEVEQGGSAPRILSLDDYFLIEKEKETKDDNGKKVIVKEMAYEYEEAMEQSYLASLNKAFKKNITDGYFNFIILDCINEKISDYEEMWSFAKTKGFQVYVCEMEMDVHICMKRNIHNRTEEEINKIVDYFEPTPNHHLKLDVNAMLQEEAIDEVHMEDSQQSPEETLAQVNEDSQDSQEDKVGVSKWEQMDADNKLDRLDGLAKKKNENRPQTMEDFLQVPDYYNMEDTPGKKRVRWADLEERKEQEKLRAVGFVVGHTNWDRMMDPTKGQSALTRTKETA